MNQHKPRIIQEAGIEVCSECGTPVGPAHEYQDPAGRIWKKRSCTACGATFKLDGPLKQWSSIN